MIWGLEISKPSHRQRIVIHFNSLYDRMLFLDALNRAKDRLSVELFTIGGGGDVAIGCPAEEE